LLPPTDYRPTIFVANRPQKKAEILARQILDDILDAGLGPGSVLPNEGAMLNHYGVGRITLREALRVLELQGLLTIRSGSSGGPIVANADGRDYGRMSSFFFRASGVSLGDLFEARMTMEPMAARAAARHHDPAGVERLRTLCNNLEAPSDVKNNKAFRHLSLGFHEAVSSMSGNPILDLMCSALIHMITDRMGGLVYPLDQRTEANSQHLAIAKAILQGDETAAEHLMHEHMLLYQQYAWEGWKGALDEVIAWR
jgi:DNA-binding FadR family transcriptional regulator